LWRGRERSYDLSKLNREVLLRRLLLLFASASLSGCFNSGDGADLSGTRCYDAEGLEVGPLFGGAVPDGGLAPEGCGFCSYRDAHGALWKVNRETGALEPAFDTPAREGFVEDHCSGQALLIGFPVLPPGLFTFRMSGSTEIRFRSDASAEFPQTRHIASTRSGNGTCSSSPFPMPHLSISMAATTVVTAPFVVFRPPVDTPATAP